MYERIKVLKKLVKGRTLDIGHNWNKGKVHKYLKNGNRDVYGMDVTISYFDDRVVKADCLKIPFKENSFNIIIAGELIEHLLFPKEFLDECHRVLNKEGILVLTTPNRDSWYNRVLRSSFHKDLAQKSPEMRKRPDVHKIIYNKQTMGKILNKCNFYINKITYLPYTEPYLMGNLGVKFIWLRKLIHYILPERLRGNMIIVTKKI